MGFSEFYPRYRSLKGCVCAVKINILPAAVLGQSFLGSFHCGFRSFQVDIFSTFSRLR
jgi:hypothetical protein